MTTLFSLNKMVKLVPIKNILKKKHLESLLADQQNK